MPFLETILAREGELPYLKWHQARLERTLMAHGMDIPYDLGGMITPPETGLWRCRVVYDAQSAYVEYLPYVPKRVDTLQAVADDLVTYRYKTTERGRLDALFALRGDADGVLIVRNGLIADTTVANVACRIDGRWLTPRTPLLAGTARARLLEAGRLLEADLTLSDAMRAEKIAVMNALSGFVEVAGGILPIKNKSG